MDNFRFHIPTEVVFGRGVEDKTGSVAAKYGSRALLVFGKGSVVRSGLLEHVEKSLAKAGVSRFAKFARRVWNVSEADDTAAAKDGIEKTVGFFRSIGMPVSLCELNVGITEADIPQLALDATQNDTLKLSRIRPLNAADVERIYGRAFAY